MYVIFLLSVIDLGEFVNKHECDTSVSDNNNNSVVSSVKCRWRSYKMADMLLHTTFATYTCISTSFIISNISENHMGAL